MDYSLKSLRDAFEDAEYKRSRLGYDLYVLLLATSLDQQFILEYLSLYHELDVLTGDRVLVIGPQLGPPATTAARRGVIHSSQLHGVHAVFSHNTIDRPSARSGSFDVAEQFLAFVQEQTRESYALCRFLGVSTSSIPLLIFFDNLDSPRDRVEWRLQGRSGHQFVRELRDILRMVSDECGWELRGRQEQLQQEADSFRRGYFTSRAVPYQLRAEWEASRQADAELRPAARLTEYFDCLAALRSAFDRVLADPEARIPLENVGTTISQLESGRLDADAFSHLDKHYRRWKSRMPPDYKDALRRMSYPYDISVYVRDGQLTATRDDAAREALNLGKKATELKGAYDSKKRELSAETERALAEVKELAAQQKPPALSVVARALGQAAAPFAAQGATSNTIRSIITRPPERLPTVFISYSHDSEVHAARVLELAQRLRADGIDCWIDQFEEGPAEGFPRWMVQQINRADVVLIICTQVYRRRFDGIEERGKGLGATFEGYLILQELHDTGMRQRRFIPIVLPESTRGDIPQALRGSGSFEIPDAYDRLVDRIFGVGGVAPHPLGRPMERPWTF